MTPPYTPPSVPWKQAESYMYKAGDGSVITGHLTYGGFSFPSAVGLKFTVEPVYDSSNRFPKWWKHTFTIETVIDPMLNPTADTTGLHPVDQNFSQFRRLLQTPGLTLEIYATGVGQNQRPDNVGNSVSLGGSPGSSPTGSAMPDGSYPTNSKQDPAVSIGTLFPLVPDVLTFRVRNNNDLNFGPRPTLLVCEPIGAARVWRIVWSVEVALPTCCIGFSTSTGTICLTPTHLNSPTSDQNSDLLVTEFNYALSWTIDDERFTIRTITGSIEVQGWMGPANKTGLDASFPTNAMAGMAMNEQTMADRLRRSFFVPPGFVREMQYDMSRDKRRMEFRLTDKEIRSDSPYFSGILDCQASMEVSGNPLGSPFSMTLDGSYKIQPGVPKVTAYLAFLTLMTDKLQYLKFAKGTAKTTIGMPFDINFVATALPRRVRWKEDIYARTCSFSFRFDVFCSLQQILFSVGMFNRGPGDWPTWNSSQSNEMYDHRGAAGVVATGREESMPMICNNQRLADDITRISPPSQKYEQYLFNVVNCPPRDQSWVDYKPTFEYGMRNKQAPIAPVPYLNPLYSQDLLAVDPNIIAQDESVMSNLGNAAKVTADYAYSTPTDDKLQHYQIQGPGEYYVISRGYAIRLCYNFAAPSLTSVMTTKGSITAPEIPQVKSSRIIGPIVLTGIGPVPMMAWYWETEYSVVGQPTGDAISLLTTDGIPQQYVTKLKSNTNAAMTAPQGYS